MTVSNVAIVDKVLEGRSCCCFRWPGCNEMATPVHRAAPPLWTVDGLTRIGLNMNVSEEDSPISLPILDERAAQCWCETNRQSSCQEDG